MALVSRHVRAKRVEKPAAVAAASAAERFAEKAADAPLRGVRTGLTRGLGGDLVGCSCCATHCGGGGAAAAVRRPRGADRECCHSIHMLRHGRALEARNQLEVEEQLEKLHNMGVDVMEDPMEAASTKDGFAAYVAQLVEHIRHQIITRQCGQHSHLPTR